MHSLLPLLIYSALVIASAVFVPVASTLLGRPRHSPYKDTPYESGIAPTGDARVRQTIPYYLVAIFFIMFDVAIILLLPWGVRLYELSWAGVLKAFVFIFFIFAALVYIWLRGGLIWRHLPRKLSETTSSLPD